MKASTTTKVVKKIPKKSYNIKGNTRQKLVIKKVLESNGKKSVSQAMRESGYPDTTASNPQQLTRSKAWKEIMEDIIPESFVIDQHKKLFDSKRIDYFSFPKTMEDEEIIQHIESVGIKVITVRPSDKGKLAFYSCPDAQAVRAAIDMANKLRGLYVDKLDVTGNLKTIVINKSQK